MTFFTQMNAVTRMGFASMPTRLGPSLVVVIGMACAVGALLSVLSLSTGIMNVVNKGRPDRAIVLSQGAQFEGGSTITRANASVIADLPGVKRTANGRPAASADVLSGIRVTKKSDGLETGQEVRGVGPEVLALRPEIRMVSGRMFQPGKFEVIVGKSASALYQNMNVGDRVDLPQGEWKIVGAFESGGNFLENSTLTDAQTLASSMRQSNYKSVTVMLDSPAALDNFRRALNANPTLAVEVTRETTYWERLSASINTIFKAIAYVVGGIMGLGAMFGAINTMYAAVSNRRVEIATLRAIGFGGTAVVFSVLAEALCLALVGALIGAIFAWAAFSGNLQSFGGLAITLAVTPAMAVNGVVFACLLAFLGGVFPALRAARQPIAIALRAT
ncbi:MAG TPA: ABC transporter permease [Rhizomicrobium sp.]|nr:ABC transporter permease [Rhizomicrobium sp.]